MADDKQPLRIDISAEKVLKLRNVDPLPASTERGTREQIAQFLQSEKRLVEGGHKEPQPPEQQAIQPAILSAATGSPPKKARRVTVPYPDPDLLRWCLNYLRKLKTARTASEIVTYWYSTWRGHRGEDRPKNITRKDKAGHVERVSKWLEYHEKQGRLRIADRKGKWNAKSYQVVDGADWRRPRRPKEP